MKVVGAFGWMSEDERMAFSQVLEGMLIKIVKPLDINESQVGVKQFSVDTSNDTFYSAASVAYKYSERDKWKELYNDIGFDGIKKELNKASKKVKSKKVIINSIEVGASPLDGFNLTISGNVVR